MRRKLLMLLALVCAVCVWADEPFRNHRYDSFKVLAPAEGSILFLGNSIRICIAGPKPSKPPRATICPS